MGQYFTSLEMKFNGTEHQMEMLKKLILLMDKEGAFDEDDIEEEFSAFDFIQTALLGTLEDRGENSEFYSRYMPDFELTCAPKLFAALFPDSEFSYNITWEYSVGGGQTIFYADYKDGKLTIKECQTEEDLDLLSDELRAKEEDGELSEEELENALLALKESERIEPARNAEYEKSFFDGDDLLAYLEEE